MHSLNFQDVKYPCDWTTYITNHINLYNILTYIYYPYIQKKDTYTNPSSLWKNLPPKLFQNPISAGIPWSLQDWSWMTKLYLRERSMRSKNSSERSEVGECTAVVFVGCGSRWIFPNQKLMKGWKVALNWCFGWVFFVGSWRCISDWTRGFFNVILGFLRFHRWKSEKKSCFLVRSVSFFTFEGVFFGVGGGVIYVYLPKKNINFVKCCILGSALEISVWNPSKRPFRLEISDIIVVITQLLGIALDITTRFQV